MGLDGNKMLSSLKRLSEVGKLKDVIPLSYALFPGYHCPLMGAMLTIKEIESSVMVVLGPDECAYYTKMATDGGGSMAADAAWNEERHARNDAVDDVERNDRANTAGSGERSAGEDAARNGEKNDRAHLAWNGESCGWRKERYGMSLCRFYPQPSDRMAIMWSLIPIEGAIVLEYGPAGTTHFGGGMYGSLGLRPSQSLFTTHISEDDVIMGDVSRLENAILELDAAYAPQVIFVVASAVIAVIGTDIVGVCNYMQEKVNARLVAFPDGGFRGDYTAGLRAVYRLLAEEMTGEASKPESVPEPEAISKPESVPEPKTDLDMKSENRKERRTYQILGASAGNYRIRSDVWEIQQLMQEAFGWRCRMVMGLETSVEELSGAGDAALNLVLRNEALEAAEIVKTRFGIPYVYDVPYGYKGTLQWLYQISEGIGEPINPTVITRLSEKMMDMQPMGGPMGSIRRKAPKAVLQGDYDTVLGFDKVLQELDISVTHKICSHSLKAFEDMPGDLVSYSSEKERLEVFAGLHDCWILGSMEAERFCPNDNYCTCVSAPFVGQTQIATHLPFMGEKGMDYLMECKNAYFEQCGI